MRKSGRETSSGAALPSAGWYPDPHGAAQQRFWDGAAWTEQIAPNAPASSVGAKSDSTSYGTPRTVALLSCVGLMIGAWAPWATTALVSESGTHGDGRFTGLFGLGAGLVLYSYSGKRPGWLTAAGVFGVIALLVSIGDISNVSNETSTFFGRDVHVVSVGWGLWLTAAASTLGLVVGATSWRAEERRRKVAEQGKSGTSSNE
jgi:hypothetical protein